MNLQCHQAVTHVNQMYQVSSDRRMAAVRFRTTVVQIDTTVAHCKTDARSLSTSFGVVITLHNISVLATFSSPQIIRSTTCCKVKVKVKWVGKR